MDRDLQRPPDRDARALAVVLHPHPGMGGDLHHPLVVAVARGLAVAGVAALRIDLRDPDVGLAAEQLTEAVTEARSAVGVDRVVAVGYSWGALVSAEAQPVGLIGRVLVAPPVATATLELGDDLPLLVLVPEHDQLGPPEAVHAALDDQPSATIEVIDGSDHLLAGAVDRIASRTAAWVTELLAPPV